MAAGVSCPEVLRGNTLEDEEEKEEGAVDLGDEERDPKDLLVGRSHTQAE